MGRLNEELRRNAVREDLRYRPIPFRLYEPGDRAALEDLLNSGQVVLVHDRLHAQVQELVKVLDPSGRYSAEDLRAAATAHLGGTDPDEYGIWFHYPWNGHLVHVLGETEFALVRTDRNRNKITRDEQQQLATKRIGVVGLSVGQSVSMVLAQERCFGEIRLADMDTLELSNMNRLRSGVQQLGSNKAINVAREIAELDPFLNVVCFTDGLTPGNIDRFFTEGGQLDLLAEECDSVNMKILARQKARELGIPVIMDTSDRGMLDVERFDLEPGRPIFHGRLENIDLPPLDKPIDPADRSRISGAIVGIENLSQRMRDSLPLIGRELCTWPQLASAVALGGASAADVIRRILLGADIPSGRTFIDLGSLIPAGQEQGVPI